MCSGCPLGYKHLIGDVVGWGPNSKLPLSKEQCARRCSSTASCQSFEHSSSDNKCNLNSQSRPDAGQYQDYYFCTKIGSMI